VSMQAVDQPYLAPDQPPSTPAGAPLVRELGVVAGVAVTALLLGILTAYAQSWLPDQVNSFANSSGSWALAAFALAMLAPGPWRAAGFGVLTLALLLAGYVLGDGIRGYPSATSTITFWAFAAVLAGPVLGLAGHWVRFRAPSLAAIGAGVMSGVLVGEGIYGLTALDTSDGYSRPGYWWGQIAVGVVLLLVLGAVRFRAVRPAFLGLAVAAWVAVAFLAVYQVDWLLHGF
jgi:hypothetical protein